MSVLSDAIEEFIKEMMEFGEAELQRNVLAQQFGCAPSQINYVLATRFPLERGYIITSRRGGGGYIRVSRVEQKDDCILDLVTSRIGPELSDREAKGLLLQLLDSGLLTGREAALMASAFESLFDAAGAGQARAKTMRTMLIALMEQDALHARNDI